MIEDDEIDLRPYVMALLRRWKLIAGLTVVAAAVAAAISLATPASYQATSTVAVAALGAAPVPAIKVYLDLATSDGVLTELSKGVGAASGGATLSPTSLRPMLKATAGSDPSLINLSVVDTDPQRVTSIANGWAGQFVQVAGSDFNPSKDSYDQLQGQLTSVRTELRQAMEQLAGIQSRSQLSLIQSQLAAQMANLTTLYASKAALQNTEDIARSLQNRLQQAPSGAQAQPSDDIAILLIQSSTLGGPTQFQISASSGQQDRPLQVLQMSLAGPQVQIQMPDQANRTVGSQLAALEGIIALIRDRAPDADKQIAARQPSIMELETKVSQIQSEQSGLIAQRDELNAALRALETKASQAKAALDAKSGQPLVITDAQIASPQPRGTTKNVALAAILGLMGGIAVAFGAEYLQSRRRPLKEMAQPVIQS